MPELATGHDIFISYASEDREKAQQLAAALEKQGWTVWWDRTIPAGKTFADVIDEALAASRCVIAMWSGVSVGKNWVLEEAQDGLDRAILVPVFIEAIEPPRGFRRIQAASLNEWDGSHAAAEFQQLVGDITHVLGPPPTAEELDVPVHEAVDVPGAAERTARLDREEASAESERAGKDAEPIARTKRGQVIRGWFKGERLTGILSAIVVIAMMIGFWIKDHFFDRATVPTVIDRPVSEAERLLKEADIRYRIETKFDPHVESDTVLYQIPKGDTLIQRDDDTVELIVAMSVTVPDLVGARIDRAEIVAKDAQLILNQAGAHQDVAFVEGAVLEQSPVPGTRVESGSALDVVLNEHIPVQKSPTGRIALEPTEATRIQVTTSPDLKDPLEVLVGQVPLPIPEMVVIPAGSIQSDGARVDVARFAMSRFEITFDEYDVFASATGRELPDDEGWGRGKRPVINVSWEDATAYTEWLSDQTGKPYRLPTDVEWEYAARGGKVTAYWWGDDINEGGKVWANCYDCGSQWDGKKTAPVGSFPANPFGLHDTLGNVFEWLQDCWDHDCGRHPIRGGSLGTGLGAYADSGTVVGYEPALQRLDIGFRLAQDID